MRILFPSYGYPPFISGSYNMVQNLGQGLAEKGHQVTVMTFSLTGKTYTVKKNNLKIIYLNSLVFNKTYGYVLPSIGPKTFKKIIIKINPQVIHLNDMYFFGFFGLNIVSVAKKLKIPLLVTHHFTPEFLLSKSPLLKPLLNKSIPQKTILKFCSKIYNQCQAVNVPNKLILDQLKKNGLKAPSYHIDNGINLKLFNPLKKSLGSLKKFGLNPKIPVFIFTGRLEIDKNLIFLLKVFVEFIKNNPNKAQLLLVGSGGQEKKLKKIAIKQKKEKLVFFTGKIINPHILAKLYASSFAFVSPSIIENQSLSSLEALASGIPVIAAQSIGQKVLVKHQKNGLLVKPNQKKEFARAMAQMLEKPKDYNKMKQNSRQSVLGYNFKKILIKHEKLYKSLIAAN